MPLDPVITVMLDRPRALRWTMAAEAKLGRLAEPPPLQDLLAKHHSRALFSLCAWLWAGIEDAGGDFAQPEALAEYLKGPDAQGAAAAALLQALRQAGVLKPEKKTVTPPPTASAGSGPSSGPTPSSSSTPRRRRMKP